MHKFNFQFWFNLLILPLVLILFTQYSGAKEAHVPLERLEVLSKGINIANWFWDSSPSQNQDYISEKELIKLKDLGYKHIRLPIDMDKIDSPQTQVHLKSAIQKIHSVGLAVILTPFGKQYNQTRTHTQWALQSLKTLAKLLKAFSDKATFLQLANEPCLSPKEWRHRQHKFLTIARSILPHHTLITTAAIQCHHHQSDWGIHEAFEEMPPYEDKNVVYAFHFYEPYAFTHQGAEWDMRVQKFKNLSYPKSEETNPPETPVEFLSQELKSAWNKAYLEQCLKPILRWQQKYKLPIIVTEYGAYPAQSDKTSRNQWKSDIEHLFRVHGILHTLWAYDAGFNDF